jgi:hypothetical protein
MPVITGTGGTSGRCVTTTGVVAQAVAERFEAVAGTVLVVSGVAVAVVGGVLAAVVGDGALLAVVGDESPAQPPATANTVRTTSAFVPFMGRGLRRCCR